MFIVEIGRIIDIKRIWCNRLTKCCWQWMSCEREPHGRFPSCGRTAFPYKQVARCSGINFYWYSHGIEESFAESESGFICYPGFCEYMTTAENEVIPRFSHKFVPFTQRHNLVLTASYCYLTCSVILNLIRCHIHIRVRIEYHSTRMSRWWKPVSSEWCLLTFPIYTSTSEEIQAIRWQSIIQPTAKMTIVAEQLSQSPALMIRVYIFLLTGTGFLIWIRQRRIFTR